ncbi:MAG: SEC-C metal-binding domain-containing protein, partial [Bacteroidota bacterium]
MTLIDPCPCGSGKKYKKCCGKKIVLCAGSRLCTKPQQPARISSVHFFL